MTASKDPLRERLRAFFFGRDVFISYCYADSAYAEALAVKLQQRKFSVFLGAWGASPGEQISEAVSAAARRSRLLVVIATPHSRASKPVEEEIGYFAGRNRPVVPVDVGLGIRATKTDWPALAGTDVIRESQDLDPKQPVPSEAVLARITNAATFTRQTARLIRFLGGVFAAVALLIGVSVTAAMWSRAIVRNARAQEAQANARTLVARKRAIGEQLLASVAQLKTSFASFRSRAANQQAILAAGERTIAAASAEREASIGSSIRIANEAAAMLEMQPARVGSAALQAVQAVRFLHHRGTRAIAADSLIRQTLELLPFVKDPVAFDVGRESLTLVTPDGRWLLEWPHKQDIFLIDTNSGERRRFSLPPDLDGPVAMALSDDGSTLAAAWGTTIQVWRIADGSSQTFDKEERIDELALSAKGDLLAHASDKRLSVMRLAGGQDASIELPAGYRRGPIFSPSGDAVAMAGERTFVWPWRAGKPLVELPSARLVRFHPVDESIVAINGAEFSVRKWVDASVLWRGTREYLGDVGFSADGTKITYIDFAEAHVLNWSDPRNHFMIPLRSAAAERIAETPWGASIAYGDESIDSFARYSTARLVGRTVHHAEILALVPRSDGTVRSISRSGAMTWWPARGGEVPVLAADPAMAFISYDGMKVLVAEPQTSTGGIPTLALYDEAAPYDSRRKQSIYAWSAVTLGADGALYAGMPDGRVLQWAKPQDAVSHDGVPAQIAVASDRITAIAAGREGRLAWAAANAVWIRDRGRPPQLLGRVSAPVTTIVFGKSDHQLAAGTSDGGVFYWNRGALTTFRRRHAIESLSISFDGAYVAATSRPESAVIWPADRPDVHYALPGDPATAIAFHPSDGTIASGDQSGVVHVWSEWNVGRASARPTEVARFSGAAYVRTMRFTDDGVYLVTVPKFGFGAKRVWKNEALMAMTCNRLSPMRDSGELGAFDIICGGGWRASAR